MATGEDDTASGATVAERPSAIGTATLSDTPGSVSGSDDPKTACIHWRSTDSKTLGSSANSRLRKQLAHGGRRWKPSHGPIVAC